MDKEVLKALKKNLKKFMKDKSLNWSNMQKHSIKERFDFPVGWHTIYKIVKKNGKSVHPNNQKEILDWFGVPCEQEYGIVLLTEKTEENECTEME